MLVQDFSGFLLGYREVIREQIIASGLPIRESLEVSALLMEGLR
jgi:hypothetical protein